MIIIFLIFISTKNHGRTFPCLAPGINCASSHWEKLHFWVKVIPTVKSITTKSGATFGITQTLFFSFGDKDFLATLVRNTAKTQQKVICKWDTLSWTQTARTLNTSSIGNIYNVGRANVRPALGLTIFLWDYMYVCIYVISPFFRIRLKHMTIIRFMY